MEEIRDVTDILRDLGLLKLIVEMNNRGQLREDVFTILLSSRKDMLKTNIQKYLGDNYVY
jgi:hypothetical protein